MTNCLTCGGAIFEPGAVVGYSGKVCHCYVPPKIRDCSGDGGNCYSVTMIEKSAVSGLIKQIQIRDEDIARLTRERDHIAVHHSECISERDQLCIELDEAADKSLRQADKYSSVIDEFLALKKELERCREALELIKRIAQDALTEQQREITS